jgi:hypothetical protein
MPDINQPDALPGVQRRLDGQSQGGGGSAARGQPPKKAVETYQEVAKTKPLDDRITILGIPVDQITPVTQAALAGLIAEINHWRSVARRLERHQEKRAAGQADAAVLDSEAFLRALGATLAQSPGEGNAWVVVLVHVSTYEDIRRSSGLLAANGTLADVAHRLRDVKLAIEKSADITGANLTSGAALPFTLLGYAGGSNLAGVVAMPEDGLEPDGISRTIRAHLGGGYVVGGIDMALAISVAAAVVGAGESPLLALGRTDHLLRSAPR